MATISVVTAVWGDRYTQFIDKWWQSVTTLERQPDEIVVITDPANKLPAETQTPMNLAPITKVITLVTETDFNGYWDLAFRSVNQDWIATCCIDDVFLPAALNAIDEADQAGAEMVADSCALHPSGTIWHGYWDPQEMFTRMTMPGAAPMKKAMYERIGGFDRHIYWSDWAFYMKAAKAGIKVHHTDIVRIIFDEGANHQTQSGRLLNPVIRQQADAQIRAYSADLRTS
jgi:hypothetical protein